MADLLLTALVDHVESYNGVLDKHEHRAGTFGVWELFQKDAPNLLPAAKLAEARVSATRPVSIPVIKTKDYAITATRSCGVIPNANESALVPLSFVTVQSGFHMVPSQYPNNYIGYQQDFDRKWTGLMRSILTYLDGLAVAKLAADKSKVNAAEGKPFDFTGNVIQFPGSYKDDVLNELSTIMFMNNINGPYNMIGSARLQALVNKLKAQGSSNGTNLAFQFGDFNIGYSNNIVPTQGVDYSFFVMPQGSVGAVTWVDPSSRMKEKAGDGTQWDEIFVKELGFKVGIKTISKCDDNSTEIGAGAEASLKEFITVSFDVALATAYNSDANAKAGVIFKGDVLTVAP